MLPNIIAGLVALATHTSILTLSGLALRGDGGSSSNPYKQFVMVYVQTCAVHVQVAVEIDNMSLDALRPLNRLKGSRFKDQGPGGPARTPAHPLLSLPPCVGSSCGVALLESMQRCPKHCRPAGEGKRRARGGEEVGRTHMSRYKHM